MPLHLCPWFFLTLIVAAILPSRAAELPPLPAGAFTVVVIPDSQGYLGLGTKIEPQSTDRVTNPWLEKHVKFIREHRDDQNIVFVTHVGDIVEKNREAEWTIAKQHLEQLRGVVPFSLTVGNHDMSSKGDAHLFQQTFPASSFKAYPWYLGSYRHDRADQNVSANNVNSAQLFSSGGLDFIHLSLECNAPDDVLAWADQLLTQHAKRRAIVTTHMDLGVIDKPKTTEGYHADPQGRMRWIKIHGDLGNSGEQLWNKLFRKHANLAFILCGDQSRVTALHRSDTGDHGNTVHAVLCDYMSKGGLRLMRFRPAENRVDFITWDTTKNELIETMLHKKEREYHQFSLPYEMKPSL